VDHHDPYEQADGEPPCGPAGSESPLRRIAQDPEAFAKYLADTQRLLLSVGANLQQLQRETRVHCRGQHVEGDRWYHARMRAYPVEKALKEALRHVNALTDGLEKTTHKRRAHAEEMKSLPERRREKELARKRKRNARRPAVLESGRRNYETERQNGTSGRDIRYSEPASLYDLRRESA
jgi:hypothetical protein